MTNLERWRLYMDGFSSPDQFIDFGFYYAISACLQRRVWYGPEHAPVFSNMYVILTAEPAIGKGLVIKQVSEVLKYHKLVNPKEFSNKPTPGIDPNASTLHKQLSEAIKQDDYEAATKHESRTGGNPEAKQKIIETPLKIPIAADATTFEALTKATAKSFRRIVYNRYDEKLQKNVPDSYGHSSLAFCLEEISSLFRKKTEDIVNFLLVAYDCGDYTYETKTQGIDRIKKCCLNFFGGTTPNFMHRSFNDSLINEGFSSRCFFIFANNNRKRPFEIPPLTSEQKDAWKHIIEHTGKLTELYGNVKFTDEAKEFQESWWSSFQDGNRPNTNIKLNPYYGRKKVHAIKMAMAIHFADSTEMVIGVESFKKALEVLAEQEMRMHYCLGLDRTNPLANVTEKVKKFLDNYPGKKFTFKDIYVEFYETFPGNDPKETCQAVLAHLEFTQQIQSGQGAHPVTKEPLMYYYSMTKSSL